MRPIQDSTNPRDRPHTYHSDSHDGERHSRIDDFTASLNLIAEHRPAVNAMPATRDSDHLPLLTDIPLGAINFVPPSPDPEPLYREAALKVPLSMEQQLNYTAGAEVRTGVAARELIQDIKTS